jgi:hypothetical protein
MCLYLCLSLHNDAVHCSAARQDRDFLLDNLYWIRLDWYCLNQNTMLMSSLHNQLTFLFTFVLLPSIACSTGKAVQHGDSPLETDGRNGGGTHAPSHKHCCISSSWIGLCACTCMESQPLLHSTPCLTISIYILYLSSKVMGGRASSYFTDYKALCKSALIEVRKHSEAVVIMMEIMTYKSSFPAFR